MAAITATVTAPTMYESIPKQTGKSGKKGRRFEDQKFSIFLVKNSFLFNNLFSIYIHLYFFSAQSKLLE